VILEWEWRPESSSYPPGFIYFGCDFRHCILEFFSIFFCSCYDLIFPEFGSIPGDDFLGIGLYQVECDLCKVWERILLIWVGFCRFLWPPSSVFIYSVVLFVAAHLVGGCTRSGSGSSATSAVRLRAVRARRSSARFWFVETSLLVPAAPLSVFYHAPLIASSCSAHAVPSSVSFISISHSRCPAPRQSSTTVLSLSQCSSVFSSQCPFSLWRKFVRCHSNFQPFILFGWK
jgi:hypothetical protein